MLVKLSIQKSQQGALHPVWILNEMTWMPSLPPAQIPCWCPLNNTLPIDRTIIHILNRFSTSKYRLHGRCPSLVPGNYEFFNNPVLLFILCYSVNIFGMRNTLARHFMKLFYYLLNSKVSPYTTLTHPFTNTHTPNCTSILRQS